MFGYAVRNDWLARNPCRNVHLPPIESTRRFDLRPEDVTGIADQVAIEYRPMVWLGAVLGLRWSEGPAAATSSVRPTRRPVGAPCSCGR